MNEMVEQYERCYYLGAYTGQECELCPHRNECEKEKTMNSTRYYRNKRMGICTECSVRPASKGILCEECAANKRSYRKIFKSPYRDEEWMEGTKKKKGEITTEDVCAMAEARGITYGVMSAILEGRMKDVPLLTEKEQ